MPPLLFMSMGHVYKFFGYSIAYILYHCGCSVTTYLCLISSPLHPLPDTPCPSGNHLNPFHTHNSVFVLFVCLVCFLDSTVDRYVFIAILLFIVLIFFLLSPFTISCNNGLVMMNSFRCFPIWETLYLPLDSKQYLCWVEQSWL